MTTQQTVNAKTLQLRDAIRRATATHLPADGRNGEKFLDGVDVRDSTWGEWEELAFGNTLPKIQRGHLLSR